MACWLLPLRSALFWSLLLLVIVFQQSQNEAASLRYEALIQQIEEDSATKFELLNTFAQKKTMAMARLRFRRRAAASENGDFTGLGGFDALAARGDLARPCAIMRACRPLLFW